MKKILIIFTIIIAAACSQKQAVDQPPEKSKHKTYRKVKPGAELSSTVK